MSNFLFEMLIEEIPHGVLPQTSQYIKEQLPFLLKKNAISYDELSYYITPRRLAFHIKGLPIKGEDTIVEQKGPSIKVAYDDMGKPTKALEGFLNSYNITLDELEEREIKGQKYIFIQKIEKGSLIEDLLKTIIQELIQNIKFNQPMHWNHNGQIYEFIRPVRGIILLLEDKVLPISLFGIESTNSTYGHRQLFPNKILITHADHYESILKQYGCIPSFEERQQIINSQIIELLKQIHGVPVLSSELLNILASLTEYPHPLLAEFDTEFLSLPKEVLISEMKIHQKYVPVLDKNGNLLPYYIIVANIPFQDEETKNNILSGNNRVLKSRFADGKFFFSEDIKKGLSFFADQLSTISFIDGAGNMKDKINRMQIIGEYLRNLLVPQVNKEDLNISISLAKADLNSLMVGEFPELQGIIGSYYAEHQKLSHTISLAIKEHYYPMHLDGELFLPTQELSALVGLADRLDNLLTLYAVGKTVTGSRDPYALRRQTIAIINILLQYQWNEFSLKDLFKNISVLYKDMLVESQEEWQKLLCDFIKIRLEGILKAIPYEYQTDTLNATLQNLDIILEDVARVEALHIVRQDNWDSFTNLIELFKRLSNILKDETIGEFKEILLQEQAEQALYMKYQEIISNMNALSYKDRLLELVGMETVISQFFESIMVKVGGELQVNRIALLSLIQQMFMKQADFSKLS